MVVEKPEVHAGRRALDFGVGFYERLQNAFDDIDNIIKVKSLRKN